MPGTVSKTDNFLKAIEKYAEEQRSKIQSEAEDFRERELNKAEEEGLREAYVLIQKKMTDIRTQIAADLSRAETASRRKTFVRRKQIEDEVFEKAAKKLEAYTKTDKYAKSYSVLMMLYLKSERAILQRKIRSFLPSAENARSKRQTISASAE